MNGRLLLAAALLTSPIQTAIAQTVVGSGGIVVMGTDPNNVTASGNNVPVTVCSPICAEQGQESVQPNGSSKASEGIGAVLLPYDPTQTDMAHETGKPIHRAHKKSPSRPHVEIVPNQPPIGTVDQCVPGMVGC